MTLITRYRCPRCGFVKDYIDTEGKRYCKNCKTPMRPIGRFVARV